MKTEIKAPMKGLKFRGLLLINRIILFLSTAFLAEWAIYGIFRCPFLVPFVSCQNCPIIRCPGRAASMFWGVWAGWLAILVFFGRGFCGWFCPGGFVNRIFSLNPFKIKLDLNAVKDLSYGKYLFLFLALGAYFYLGQPRVDLPIRVGEFWQSIPLTFNYASDIWLFRSWLVIVLFLFGLLISQAWCRFACPMGGLLELLKRFSIFKVYKTSACINCDKCRKVCYMQTRPQEINCTNCADCIQVCPENCIGIGIAPKGKDAYKSPSTTPKQ